MEAITIENIHNATAVALVLSAIFAFTCGFLVASVGGRG